MRTVSVLVLLAAGAALAADRSPSEREPTHRSRACDDVAVLPDCGICAHWSDSIRYADPETAKLLEPERDSCARCQGLVAKCAAPR